MKLDAMTCDECGKVGCVSWSAPEGARCDKHSSYIGPRAEKIQREAEERYRQQDEQYGPALAAGMRLDGLLPW